MNKGTNNSNGRVVLGALLIVFGIIFFMNNFEFEMFNIDLLSWPVIIFILGIFVFLKDKTSIFGIILMLVGGLNILTKFFDISIRSFLYEFWPFLLIILGIYFVFKKSNKHHLSDHEFVKSNEYLIDIFTIIGETHKVIKTNRFLGGKISSILGETQIDLRNSKLAEGKIELDTLTMFASTEIHIPSDWKVFIKTTTIFGGFEDLRSPTLNSESTNILIIKGLVLFGGGEIK